MEQNYLPSTFAFAIGNHPGPLFSIQLSDGCLIYKKTAVAKPVCIVVKPSAEDWCSLWRKLERLHIWNWQTQYPSATDATTPWSVTISFAGRYVVSEGMISSANGWRNDPANPINRLVAAISTLVGGLEIF